MGVVDLLLSLIFLGPALLEPRELLEVLLAGFSCLVIGIAFLQRHHRRLLAGILIPFGLFYIITGLGGGELTRSLLIFGLALVITAIAVLFPKGRRGRRRAEEEGNRLFDARREFPEETRLQICFGEQEMLLHIEDQTEEHIPYEDFLAIIEGEELLMIAAKNKGFFLGKREMTVGEFPEFKDWISQKTTWICGQRKGTES